MANEAVLVVIANPSRASVRKTVNHGAPLFKKASRIGYRHRSRAASYGCQTQPPRNRSLPHAISHSDRLLFGYSSPMLAFAAESLEYTFRNQVVLPTDYREWVCLTSSLDLNYNDRVVPGAGMGARCSTTSLYNPRGLRGVREKTGTWPDKTILVKENRAAHPSAFCGTRSARQRQIPDRCRDAWSCTSRTTRVVPRQMGVLCLSRQGPGAADAAKRGLLFLPCLPRRSRYDVRTVLLRHCWPIAKAKTHAQSRLSQGRSKRSRQALGKRQ